MKLFCFCRPTNKSSHWLRYMMAFLFCATGFVACIKKLPDCNINCTKVIFSGKITNLATGQGIKNVQVEVYLIPGQSGGLFNEKPDYLAASGGTKKDGTFSFSPVINIGYFNTYTTAVNAYIPDDYIQFPITATSSGFEKPSDFDTHTFYHEYDSAAFRNLNFGFYRQTKLQVHVHRTSPYASGGFITYDFHLPGAQNGDGASFTESATNKDTTISVLTAADAYTIISRTRHLPGSPSTDNTEDSVRCTKDGTNSIDVYY